MFRFFVGLVFVSIMGIAGYWGYKRYGGGVSDASPSLPGDTLCSDWVKRLEKRLSKEWQQGGEVAVHVRRYPGSCSWGKADTVPFPPASLNKLAIACKVLSEVDSGRLALDQNLPLHYDDLRPFSPLAPRVKKGQRIEISVQELLEWMLRHSDNASADRLLAAVGGMPSVQKFLDDKGLGKNIALKRNLLELFADLYQVAMPKDKTAWSYSEWERRLGKQSPTELDAGRKAIHDDLRDRVTARAVVDLLEALALGKLLSERNTLLLWDIMSRSERGAERLPALLPEGYRAAHKTGTLRGMVHDAGMVFDADGKHVVLIAVLIRRSPNSLSEDEARIARIAKAAIED